MPVARSGIRTSWSGSFCGGSLALRNYWLRNSTSCGEAGRVEAAHICSFIAKPRESS